MCVVIRALELDSSSVTPGSLGVDEGDDRACRRPSPGPADGSPRSAKVTPILRPVTAPSAYVVAGMPLSGLPDLAESRRQQHLAAHDAWQQCLLLLVGAGPGHGERAAAERLPDRQVVSAGTGHAEQHAHLGQPEPLAAVGLGNAEPEQPGLGELGPAAVAVEHVGEHRPHRRQRLRLVLGTARGPPA